MVKLEYLVPEMDVIQFEAEDVITGSSGGLNFGGDLNTEDDKIHAGDLFP